MPNCENAAEFETENKVYCENCAEQKFNDNFKVMANAKVCPDIYHAFSKFLNSKEEKSSLSVEYNSDEFSVMFLKLESGNIRIRTDEWLQMTQIQNDLVKQDINYAGPLLITDFIDFTPEQAEKVVQTIR